MTRAGYEALKAVKLGLAEPADYFRGVAPKRELPTPSNILVFMRTERDILQQEALQNRSHHRHVLVCNLATRGHVHVDQHVIRFEPRQMLLILPYQFHHYGRLARPDLKWLFVTFECTDAAFVTPLRNRAVRASEQAWDRAADVLRAWLRCSGGGVQDGLFGAQLQTAVLQLLVALQLDRRAVSPALPVPARASLLSDVNRYMSEHSGHQVAVADVAAAFGMSVSSLRARFKAAAGVPVGGYLRNYRLNRAMALLRTSEMPISEIAHESGFASLPAFSRLFKQKVGQTPRDYRRRSPPVRPGRPAPGHSPHR